DEVHESAKLDGAGDWGRLRHVTLPLIAPAIAVAVVFCVVWSMRAFDVVYLLTKGGPGEATTLLSYLTFTKAFEFGDLGAWPGVPAGGARVSGGAGGGGGRWAAGGRGG